MSCFFLVIKISDLQVESILERYNEDYFSKSVI